MQASQQTSWPLLRCPLCVSTSISLSHPSSCFSGEKVSNGRCLQHTPLFQGTSYLPLGSASANNVSNQPPHPTTAWNFVLNQILVPIHTLSKCYPLLCFFYFSFLIYDMWGEGRERDRKRERRALIHC